MKAHKVAWVVLQYRKNTNYITGEWVFDDQDDAYQFCNTHEIPDDEFIVKYQAQQAWYGNEKGE